MLSTLKSDNKKNKLLHFIPKRSRVQRFGYKYFYRKKAELLDRNMTSERIQINLRGHCLFCLGKINGNNGDLSPTCTPTSSPLSTPLRNRYHNIHSVPPEERLAPFTDLCRFLGVELPDSYAFGDGSEPEMLTPPLCHKCFELTARLCVLQDELQYVQSKISNTVKRVYQRVTGSCGSHKRRGALKREAFLKEFGRNSKDFLSRGRGKVSGGGRKVTDLVKSFQLKVIEKGRSCEQTY